MVCIFIFHDVTVQAENTLKGGIVVRTIFDSDHLDIENSKFLMCKYTSFKETLFVMSSGAENHKTIYITLLFDQTRQMLILLSFTTETNLFLRTSSVML